MNRLIHRILFLAFYKPLLLFTNLTQAHIISVFLKIKSRYKSRFICQCYKKKSRPPYLYGIGGLSV